eukprot:126721-Pyramimonas_sp.AAC.1
MYDPETSDPLTCMEGCTAVVCEECAAFVEKHMPGLGRSPNARRTIPDPRPCKRPLASLLI